MHAADGAGRSKLAANGERLETREVGEPWAGCRAGGTGKSTLLRRRFWSDEVLYIDLLDPVEEDQLNRNPAELEQRVRALPPETTWILIDEIQKAPRLLDSVHRLIEEKRLKFALTGSSARKLRRGSSNLLAGRHQELRYL